MIQVPGSYCVPVCILLSTHNAHNKPKLWVVYYEELGKIWLIGSLQNNFSEIWMKIQLLFIKMNLKMLSMTWCPFRIGLNFLNILWPSDTTWWHRYWSILAQAMVCCLRETSHYLNQCPLLINKVLWYFTAGAQTNILYNGFENYTYKITDTSLRGQWVETADMLILLLEIRLNFDCVHFIFLWIAIHCESLCSYGQLISSWYPWQHLPDTS